VAAARRAPGGLARRVAALARVGLGLLVLLTVLVLASAWRVAVDGDRAVSARQAEAAAADLLAGMADQQTGLVTYLRPAQPDSLLLYPLGREKADGALAALRRSTAGTRDAAQEARVEGAVAGWQRWADDVRARSVAAGLPVTDPVDTARGRQLFAVFAAERARLAGTLDGESAEASGRIEIWMAASVGVALVGSLAVGVGLAAFALYVRRRVLGPLRELGEAAVRVEAEGRTTIPYGERRDEVGELARALEGWQEASAVRTILVEQAPVGICRIDEEGRLLTTNAAFESMLGYARGELTGHLFWTLVHPDERLRARGAHRTLLAGGMRDHRVEARWLRADGSSVWSSVVASPVLATEGRPGSLIAIVEDIAERKRQAELAARIQRNLLPRETPALEGYELAGVCLAAQEVGGDFFDWVASEDGRTLDVTVADVMGKGVGAALVMATLRAALRSAPVELGPGARAGLVAESLMRGLSDVGLFVTLFHGRLELGTGRLRYVDAGHGHCVVRRASGEAVALARRSLPLGVVDEGYEEGELELEAGDTLLVYTDGLVELDDRTLGPGELVRELEGPGGAEEMLGRLVGRVQDRQGQQADDITVVVLQRRPGAVEARLQASEEPGRPVLPLRR
jgi:PAS domain S-box-containing protein